MSHSSTLPRPFLRAYLAGVALPSLVVCAVAFRFWAIPGSVERAMIFPMAINPFMWGVWNALHLGLQRRWHIPIGWFGALLAILLILSGSFLRRRSRCLL